MKKALVMLLTFVILTGLIVTPALAQMPTEQTADRVPPTFETPTRPEPQLVPQEIEDLFKDGISVEEFLAINKGPVPNAVMAYANLPLTVIVQLEGPSLIAYMDNHKGINGIEADKEVQQSYVAQLESTQESVINQIGASGIDAVVMGRYTKVLNGFMARVPFNDLETIRGIPGVKSVSKAPEHTIDLSISVPLIGADLVHAMGDTGYTGESITVAVIDTGIDYTHAMFETTGDPSAYTANNPNIVESGSFPTPKVIGGYDFAGTDYDAGSDDPARLIPVPDPDPLDEGGHGTHVASTVAGVDAGFGTGVAPDALLYALKVFGAEGSTNLVVDAIEWAIDPNGDGFIDDHVDVINMSLGSSFGPAIPDDPEFLAVEAANTAGVFVVASSGNAGNVNYVTGSPANTDSALSVASSTTGYMTAPYVVYAGGEIPYTTSANVFASAISAELVDVADYGDTAGTLCSTAGVTPMTGKIALIIRGTCSFYIKINNAETLGAVAAIVYNNAAGSISMATAGSSLPAGSILQSDGIILKGLAPLNVVVGPDTTVKRFISPTPADTISDFSSRGPRGFDSMLKPEITAPGSEIFAANMGSGNQGVSMSGTSMAAPHMAGVVALMKQAHPTWTNQQIKAALMNTAVDLGGGTYKVVPRQGAGRVDVLKAITTKVVAIGDPKLVSLNWGLLELHENSYTSKKSVTLRNFSDLPVTLDLAAAFTTTTTAADLLPDTTSVTIPAYGSKVVTFTLTLNVTALPITFGGMEELFGYVTFTNADTNLRLPFYFVPRPYPMITETAKETTFDVSSYGYVNLVQDGPVPSSLWTFPVTLVSDNAPAVMDPADLRYVGMDFDGTNKVLVPAFNMWGGQHTNQPYWSEVDLWIYGDAPEPVVNFNYNLGALTTNYPDNRWRVVQIDYNDGQMYLTPYSPYTDFNSGFQKWYLPPSWIYVTDTFEYEVISYDWYGHSDYAGAGQFDITRLPFWSAPLNATLTGYKYDPFNEPFSLVVEVDDLGGYLYSAPKGIMLVDYNGKPGVGQAYYWPITVTGFPKLFLPIINR